MTQGDSSEQAAVYISTLVFTVLLLEREPAMNRELRSSDNHSLTSEISCLNGTSEFIHVFTKVSFALRVTILV